MSSVYSLIIECIVLRTLTGELETVTNAHWGNIFVWEWGKINVTEIMLEET